jgi:hypothetical protein
VILNFQGKGSFLLAFDKNKQQRWCIPTLLSKKQYITFSGRRKAETEWLRNLFFHDILERYRENYFIRLQV